MAAACVFSLLYSLLFFNAISGASHAGKTTTAKTAKCVGGVYFRTSII
jgi:hypothetical protein